MTTSDHRAPARRTPARWWWVLTATAVVTGTVDAVGKVWANSVGTAWDDRVDADTNDAYALGSIGGSALILSTISLLVLAAVIWWTARRRRWFHPWAVGLLVGGGAANAIDRLVNGAVTDFLVIGPVLINLADVAIVAGLAVMSVDAARALRRDIAAAAAPSSVDLKNAGR